LSIDINAIARPLFRRELVPVFMMIETDLFQQLNAKAAARRIGYDMLLRAILREHIGAYGTDRGGDAPQRPAPRERARKKGGKRHGTHQSRKNSGAGGA
jgi:hypothetical protein